MIVECAAFADGSIEWNGRDVLASAKKVNLNQIRLARKKLLLFAHIQFASLLTRCFVREAQDLDRGHESFAFVTPNEYLDKRFTKFVMGNLDRDGTRHRHVRNGRSAGDFGTR